ncbi:MAG: DUF3810 family protein [Clostridia bacterium]|nr:DUF3810 family protein [Clostridia bacterium]
MAENEKQEGLQMEEIEALAGEFTLDDLAEFDNEFEFDISDLESIKPVYTTKEKLKLILMNNTVFSIIKWCIAALGIVGLVLYILAAVNSDISESLTTSLSSGVRGVLTSISNLLPFSLMEVLVMVVAVGILGYAGFLIFKTIKEKEGIKIAGFWVQFAYVLLAIFGVGFLIYTMCFGVTTNRTKLYNSYLKDSYRPTLFTEQTMDGAVIYFTDQINEVAVDGMSNIFYTASGHSRYASTGSSLKEISEAVNACFDAAAEDEGMKFLKGGKVTAKKLMFPALYSAMGVGSIYSPITSEVLINTDYPEVIVPMQVARAIAKQRGITDDADASFVAFLVLTQYADAVADSGSTYNMDYIKYAAYMDAYMEVGSVAYKVSPDMHLYCTAALKESAKKDVVAYVKNLDALYGNVSKLEFVAASEKTSTSDYKVLAKLLYRDFMDRVDEGQITLSYPDADNPVPVRSQKYYYARYLVSYFAAQEASDWGNTVDEVFDEYNPEPLPNDGSGTGLEEAETTTDESTGDEAAA